MTIKLPGILMLCSTCAAMALSGGAHAVDAEAAEALAKRNNCFKCHGKEKPKSGPSLKSIADKYKGKEAEAEPKLIKHMTTGPKVKLLDEGSEQDHKIIDTKDTAEMKNLIQWIFSFK